MKRPALTRLLVCVTAGTSFAVGARDTAQVHVPDAPKVAPACTYSMSPTDLSNISPIGGQLAVTVTTPTACSPFEVTSFQPWVTVNSMFNNGPTTAVTLGISSNSGAARSTSIKVADRLFQVAQNGCPGFSNIRFIVANWANPGTMLTSSAGGFGQNDIVVIQITTGSSASGETTLQIAGAEFGGPQTRRVAALSATPCDFVGLRDPSTNIPYPGGTVDGGTSVGISFTVDNPNNGGGFYPILHVNTTYYLNVKNIGCSSVCDMSFVLLKSGNP